MCRPRTVIRTIKGVPRKRASGLQKRRSPQLNCGVTISAVTDGDGREWRAEGPTSSISRPNSRSSPCSAGRPRKRRARSAKAASRRLARYRDGLLLLGKSAGTGHWETHPEDELVHVLDGAATLDIVCDGRAAKSFALGAGMIAVVPPGAWHRFHSVDGKTHDERGGPRRAYRSRCRRSSAGIAARPTREMGSKPPSIDRPQRRAREAHDVPGGPRNRRWRIERAALRDWLPTATALLLAIKFAGKDHWERHLTGDELIHILDGSASLEIVCDDGPPNLSRCAPE